MNDLQTIQQQARDAWEKMTPAEREKSTDAYRKEMQQMQLDAEKKATLINLMISHHQQISNGLVQVPLKTMLHQILYLQNDVLPQALSKLGADSESYKFYKGITDTLLWAITLGERAAYWKKEYQYQRSAIEFYRAEGIRLREKLEKYNFTADTLFDQANFDDMMKDVRDRMSDVLTGRDDLRSEINKL